MDIINVPFCYSLHTIIFVDFMLRFITFCFHLNQLINKTIFGFVINVLYSLFQYC